MNTQLADVHGPASNDPAEASHPASTRGKFLGWLTRAVPTALVLASVGGLAYWGHLTEWTFALGGHSKEKASVSQRPCELAVVRIGSLTPDSGLAPAALRRKVTITFDSTEAVEKAAIDISPAWTTAMTEAVPASGEASFDPSQVARLSARAPGMTWWVAKAVGDPVAADELLALIDATEVGRVKAEFLQALVQVRLKQKALANIQKAKVVPERQKQEAEAALRDTEARLLSAEQALVNLGLPIRASDCQALSLDEVVQRMRLLGVPEIPPGQNAKSATANLLPVRASFSGVVLTADVVAGEVVEAGKPLFVVVDPRHLWLTLHYGPEDARRIAVGQKVKFRPDGTTDEFDGQVTWVGTSADETTRTIPIRAELANDAGRLRASTLGRGRVILREEPSAVVVPHGAIQMYQGTPVVFVRDPAFLTASGPKAFHVRVIRTGAKDAENTEVLAGLKANDVVATKGSALLLNELKRSLNTNGNR